MASMRDIKRRKTSISSTQQITKAMKLVSTVKLQKAKNKAEETTPYFRYMYQTVCSMLAKAGNIDHPYLRESASDQKGIIVITSNRGLAGGYNSNIIRLITGSDIPLESAKIYTGRLWRAKAITWSPTIRMSWRLLLMRMRRRSVRKS